MRISFFILDITTGGGIERTTSLLSNTFVQNGHQVTIISAFRQNKIPIYNLNEKIDVVYFLEERYTHNNPITKILAQYFKVIKAAKSYYRKNQFDVIIGQAFLACFFLWITGNAHKAYACEHFKYGMYNRWIRAFRNRMYRSFRSVITLTDNDYRTYHSKGLRVSIIPNIAIFNINGAKKQETPIKRMISVGRLNFQKGYDLLLLALKPVFKKHPEWNIYIYGEGEERQRLENLRDNLDLTNHVFFPGFVRDIQGEYLQSSFYVMSSRYEGLPMVLLEAMACGLPIVSFNCPEGPAQLLKDGAGLLIPPENVEELTKGINRMIEDETLRSNLREQAYKKVKEYSPEKVYSQWINLFNCSNTTKR